MAVPIDRAPQALLQLDRRLPAERLADLRRVHILAVDLARRISGAANVRLDPGARELGDQRDHVADSMGAPAAGVEGLTADIVALEPVGDRQVSGRGVLDVEEVALG